MKLLQIQSEIKQYKNIQELPEDEVNLIEKARLASEKSYAPYSNFKVGVALLLENGEVVTGNNQENAAYPSGLCAERTAIFWANSQYPTIPVKKIAVTAVKHGKLVPTPLSPCGSCRQVMIETETRFSSDMKIIMDSATEIWTTESAKELLPLFFYGKDLE